MLVYSNVKKEDLFDLIKLGFDEIEKKRTYEILKLRNGKINLTLFASGKLVVGGKEKDIDGLKKIFNFNKFDKVSFPNKNELVLGQNVIGSDEALKGDTFGGIIVCAFYCKEEDVFTLQNLGVKDSKQYDSQKILFIAEQIKNQFPESYFIKEISPQDYNDLLLIETTTKVLNDMHEFAGHILKRRFGDKINQVVDEFPGCKVGDIITKYAESKYLAVAAASILAKARGIEQIKELSEEAKINFPLGSSHVKKALGELRESKLNPKLYCKTNFRNVKLEYEIV
jgi:ribonuclease HIII